MDNLRKNVEFGSYTVPQLPTDGGRSSVMTIDTIGAWYLGGRHRMVCEPTLYSLRQSERAGISVCIGDEFCLLDYLENLHSLFILANTNTFV
jgi:hypothetical protein